MSKKEYSKNFISGLIKKELKIEFAKISTEDKDKGVTSIGNLTMEQIVKVAQEKKDSLATNNLKNAVKLVLGTANSMTGILVENKRPKELIKEIDEGKWDNLFK
jgi:large subunit ribosomal protein L11